MSKTTHLLIPEHRKLSKEEEEEILKKYNAKKEQFPKISLKDPAIKNMDVKKGDIIEIKRKSYLGEEYFYYRVVVD